MAILSTTLKARRLVSGSAHYETFAPVLAKVWKRAGRKGTVCLIDDGNVVLVAVMDSTLPLEERDRLVVPFNVKTGMFCADGPVVVRNGWKAFFARTFWRKVAS